jgi:hypothetical protein
MPPLRRGRSNASDAGSGRADAASLGDFERSLDRVLLIVEDWTFTSDMSATTAARAAVSSNVAVRLFLLVLLLGILPGGFAV